jgi:hypothetical protein
LARAMAACPRPAVEPGRPWGAAFETGSRRGRRAPPPRRRPPRVAAARPGPPRVAVLLSAHWYHPHRRSLPEVLGPAVWAAWPGCAVVVACDVPSFPPPPSLPPQLWRRGVFGARRQRGGEGCDARGATARWWRRGGGLDGTAAVAGELSEDIGWLRAGCAAAAAAAAAVDGAIPGIGRQFIEVAREVRCHVRRWRAAGELQRR